MRKSISIGIYLIPGWVLIYKGFSIEVIESEVLELKLILKKEKVLTKLYNTFAEEPSTLAHRRRVLQAAAHLPGQQRHRAEGVRRHWRRTAPPARHPRCKAIALGRNQSLGSVGGHHHGQRDSGKYFAGGATALHAGRWWGQSLYGRPNTHRCCCRGTRITGLSGDGGGTSTCSPVGQRHGNGQCVGLLLAQHRHRGQAPGSGPSAILHGVVVAAQQPQEPGQPGTQDHQAQDQRRANGFSFGSVTSDWEAAAGGVLVTNGSRNIYLSARSRQLDPES